VTIYNTFKTKLTIQKKKITTASIIIEVFFLRNVIIEFNFNFFSNIIVNAGPTFIKEWGASYNLELAL